MKPTGLILSFLLVLGVSAVLTAQQEYIGAEKTHALKVGTTPPLRDILPRNPTDAFKLSDWEDAKPEYVRNFIGRRQVPVVKEGSLPEGKDPLVDQWLTRDGGLSISPIVNVEGFNQQQSGSGVPDPNGDVSDQYFMQVVNSTWLQVYDLSGNKIGNAFRANTIWSQIGFSSAGDPILLYDQQVGRWFLTEFPPSSRVLIAVSDTGDPLGTWTAYAFSTPSFPDYPKYGIWQTAYILSTNEGGNTIKFYTINRDQILAGADTVDIQRFSVPKFSDPNWQTLQPVDWSGDSEVADSTYPMVMRINDDAYGDSPVDAVEIYEIHVDWDNEDSSKVVQTQIPTAPFDSEFCSAGGFGFACVPQPNGQGIDGIPYIFMNACHYRNFGPYSTIVGNFTVDVTGNDDAGVRWVELRKTGDGPWELYQEGTVGSDDGLNRFMGGIEMDSKGNIGLAYSVSSENYFPSLRLTGRHASDPLGKMSAVEYEFAKGGGSVSSDRFGDYASMSVDPQDVFWYTGEYVKASGDWATKIVGFKLGRDSVDIGPRQLLAPADSPDLGLEQVTACVINQGLLPQTELTIGLITEDSGVISESLVIDSLFTDSVFCYTFDTLLDFSAFGPHIVTVFTASPLDSNYLNDTCRFTVNKLTTWDASIASVSGLSQVLCDTFTQLSFILENIGVAELTTVDVIYSVNSGMQDTIAWTGNLARGETEEIPVDITGLFPGDNTVLVFSENPNGIPDQDMVNDTLQFGIFSTPGGQETTLLLTTDDYPDETTWELLDSSGTIILQGGPYSAGQTEYMQQWCLDTSQCYTFVLLDQFGDGIQAGGIAGNFQIVNAEGIIVASLNNPDFGFTDTTRFCLQSNCSLVANVFIKHETRPDGENGTISIFSSGGIAPLQFSVNGGQTFQSSSFFGNLAPGDYVIVVRDGRGCIFVKDVTLLGCDMQAMATVTQASGPQTADGSIALSVEGNHGALTYSVDGGANFQTDPVFEGLLPDTFAVVIRDSVGCQVTLDVIVDFSSAVRTQYVGHLVRVFPNPSSGYFQFELEGLPNTMEIQFDLLSSDGRYVKSGIASNYSGVIKGYFSLATSPPGEYYLRFRHPSVERLIPVIRL